MYFVSRVSRVRMLKPDISMRDEGSGTWCCSSPGQSAVDVERGRARVALTLTTLTALDVTVTQYVQPRGRGLLVSGTATGGPCRLVIGKLRREAENQCQLRISDTAPLAVSSVLFSSVASRGLLRGFHFVRLTIDIW